MRLTMTCETTVWPMRERFAISRGVHYETVGLCVTLDDGNGSRGRGEACGVDYAGETPASMLRQCAEINAAIEAGPNREDLLSLLPAGGARFALDSAMWDLEAKQTAKPACLLAGLESQSPVDTAFTIGIRPVADYEGAARGRAEHRLLKLKVDHSDPIGAVRAARAGAPDSVFIVDPNQSWSVEQLKELAPRLVALGVVLLEQPIPVGSEAGLGGYRCPIKLCADELVNSVADLDKVVGRFDVINIKLDKAGGLTAGLLLAAAARARGLGVMVGCMAGSSLTMAPATILAQGADFVDLDGPLLQSADWPHPLRYEKGRIFPPTAELWG
ncbi:dipeptide epimerase [Sphingosinicellaceae bacterium]|nr:dipeptide epimerase [Sphingosinicellaceae bacterium]